MIEKLLHLLQIFLFFVIIIYRHVVTNKICTCILVLQSFNKTPYVNYVYTFFFFISILCNAYMFIDISSAYVYGDVALKILL